MDALSRRRAAALLLSALLPRAACGVARDRVRARGLVYHLSKGDTHFWLAGSLHRLRRRDHPLPEAYESAYRDCRSVFFEFPRDVVMHPDFQRRMSAAQELAEGRSLETEVPAGVWLEVVRHARRLGVSVDVLRRLRPWFAAWRLMEAAYDAQGIRVEFGIEETFYHRAGGDGKLTGGLDPAAVLTGGQPDGSGRGGSDDGVSVLRGTLRELDRAPAIYAEMIAIWRRGDEREVARTFAGTAATRALAQRAPVSARNRRWIRRIEREGKAFHGALILPGISHIPGRDGLLAGLTAAGWKAERWE